VACLTRAVHTDLPESGRHIGAALSVHESSAQRGKEYAEKLQTAVHRQIAAHWGKRSR